MIRASDWTYFRHGMTTLCQLFSRELAETTLETFWLVLAPFGREAFSFAINQHCEESKYFPTPNELRQLAKAAYRKAKPEELRRRAAEEKAYHDEMESQLQELKNDPVRFARNKQRLAMLTACVSGAHRGPRADCDSCQFQRHHPRSHLHFAGRPGALTAADIDWHGDRVRGCCA